MSKLDETYRTIGLAGKVRDTAHAVAAAIQDVDKEKDFGFDALLLANDVLKRYGFVLERVK